MLQRQWVGVLLAHIISRTDGAWDMTNLPNTRYLRTRDGAYYHEWYDIDTRNKGAFAGRGDCVASSGAYREIDFGSTAVSSDCCDHAAAILVAPVCWWCC